MCLYWGYGPTRSTYCLVDVIGVVMLIEVIGVDINPTIRVFIKSGNLNLDSIWKDHLKTQEGDSCQAAKESHLGTHQAC